MLTIKQITDNTEEVIRGLEKKHFKDAKATIEQVLAFNDKRRSTQNQLDKNLAEVKLPTSVRPTCIRIDGLGRYRLKSVPVAYR